MTKIQRLKNIPRIIKVFLIVGFIEAMCFSLLVPAGRVPDDATHFTDMQLLSGFRGFGDEFSRFYRAAGINKLNDEDNPKQVDWDLYIEEGMKPSSRHLGLSPKTFSPAFVKYFPALIGFLIACAFHAPILVMFQLCEFFSILFFLIVGAWTLHIAPFKKSIFLFCLLMPMSMQQCASINADAVLIPTSYLLFAYILKYREEGERVGWKQVGILLGLIAVVTLSKVIYFMLALFIFLIPLNRFDLKIKGFDVIAFYRKYWFLCWAALLVMVALGIYVLRDVGYVKVLLATLLEPKRTARLFLTSIQIFTWFFVVTFAGTFGYLEATVSDNYTWALLVAAFIVAFFAIERGGYETTNPLKIRERVWMILVMMIVAAFVIEAHVSWSFYVLLNPGEKDSPTVQRILTIPDMRASLHQMDMIVGMQGRYFIPTFPAVMTAFSAAKGERIMRYVQILMAGFYAYSMYYVFDMLLVRYWL